jgi:hypothetical protein
MNRMTKIILSIIILIIMGIGVLIGLSVYSASVYANNHLENNTDSVSVWPDEVDWETAVEILNTGQVAEVVQYHNREVTLTLDDGSQIKTIEPAIDIIFQEIELCGRVCSETVLITE